MTDLTFKLSFAGQPEMAGSTTLLAGQALLDPHIPIMLSACNLIGKPLSKNQCVHVFFHANVINEYAKLCRGV